MFASRIPHLAVVALVGAFGSNSATTGASGAPAAEAPRATVSIHLIGTLHGPQVAAVGRGRFTASGAFSDRGSFVDVFRGSHPPGDPHVLTLRGARGTLVINVDRSGNWRIARGKKAYAGLRGHGTDRGRYSIRNRIDWTMIGTVSR